MHNIILYCDVVTRFWAGGMYSYTYACLAILRISWFKTHESRGQIRAHTVHYRRVHVASPVELIPIGHRLYYTDCGYNHTPAIGAAERRRLHGYIMQRSSAPTSAESQKCMVAHTVSFARRAVIVIVIIIIINIISARISKNGLPRI